MNETGLIPCPFCPGTYEARGAPDNEGTHSEPTCQKWNELDLMEFVIEARKAHGIALPGEN